RGYIIYLLEHADWCQPDRLPAYIDYQFFECSEVQDDCMPGSPIYMWLEENGLLFTPYPLVKRAGVVDE
ncbi:hypothetical protein OAI54_04755, partial [Pseudomonadales bacterium]|nr:hypothetical protein [Pseudomonadales bacterium]